MSLNLTNLFYSEKDIGATLKISKRQFIWEFDLNGSSQRIELLDSRFTRKKRLFKNGVNILNTTEQGNFIHNFEIDGHACVIIQYGDKIELRIDNQSFTHLYNLQKNKKMFAGEKGPTSNIYVAKPYSSFGSSEEKGKENNEGTFYKVSKPEEENKPKLFNFEIKKDTGNKSHGFNSKFKFGANKEHSSSISNKNNNNINNNNNNNNNNLNNNNNNNNKGNIDLLGFQDQGSNNNNTDNNNNNNINNNNNLLDFGGNNNSNTNNQNNQNQQKSGNDIFDLFGNSNNQNNNNQNNNNNNNPYNNIFLAISDGTNQQPTFDQNNLAFMGVNNNMNNNNNNSNNNMNMMNNNFNNLQNQQMNHGLNQNNNNNENNQQNNNLNIDLLNF